MFSRTLHPDYATPAGACRPQALRPRAAAQPVPVEQAQKVLCRGFSFQCVAFRAGGNQVAVRIAAPPHKRDDMVEAARASGQPPQTIEARAAFARMNSFPQLLLKNCNYSDLSWTLRSFQFVDFRKDIEVGLRKLFKLWGIAFKPATKTLRCKKHKKKG